MSYGDELRRVSNGGTTMRIGTHRFPLPVSPLNAQERLHYENGAACLRPRFKFTCLNN